MKKKIIAITLSALAVFSLFAGLVSALETSPEAEQVTMCILDPEEVLC